MAMRLRHLVAPVLWPGCPSSSRACDSDFGLFSDPRAPCRTPSSSSPLPSPPLPQSRSLLSLLVVVLLATCAVSSADEAVVSQTGSAKLIVQKQLDHNLRTPFNFAIDAPINVTFTVVNVGDAAAYDVVLEDSWAAGFEVSGSGTQKWDELPSGATAVVSYFVTPQTEGEFISAPARITYQAQEGASTLVTGYSSSVTNLNVISAPLFAKLTNTHTIEWTLVTALLAIFIVAPALKWYDLSSSFVKGNRRKAE